MLKSIGAFVFVRWREVVRFWEGPLREVPLYAGAHAYNYAGVVCCSSRSKPENQVLRRRKKGH